jgi:hypothetical protein
MPGQAGEVDTTRFQMNKEQHVVGGEPSPGEHLDREEVGAGQDGQVGGNEILPVGLLAPLPRRGDSVSAKDVSHRLIGDGMAGIGRSSDNAVVSPTGVLSGEADKGTTKTLLQLIQEKMQSQGKTPPKRTDMRINLGPQGKILVLNKFDGIIRLLVP